MKRKSRIIIFFALALLLLTPGIVAGAKARPELAVKKKTMAAGQTYRLRLNGVSRKAKVKWKTSNKSVVTIAKKKGIQLRSRVRKKERLQLRLFTNKRNTGVWLRFRQKKRKSRRQTIRC